MQSDQRLVQAFVQDHPQEVARQVESLPAEEAAALLQSLSAQEIASVAEHLLPAPGSALLRHLPLDRAADVTAFLSSSSSVAILRHCDPHYRNELLDCMDSKIGASLVRALTYPEWTAGSMADPRVLTLSPDITVAEALTRIRRDHRNTTYYLYILERDNTLTGVISIKQLVTREPRDLVGSVMNSRVVTLSARLQTEVLLKHPHWRQFHTMPVVDRGRTFLGVLRYRTLRKIEEETFPESTPGGLSHALISLWEAYALTGIKIMTEVAGALIHETQQTTPPSQEIKDHDHGQSTHPS